MLRYNLLASIVCDINLKLSRNKGGPKQHNVVFHYCLSEIMPLDFRTSQLTSIKSCQILPILVKYNNIKCNIHAKSFFVCCRCETDMCGTVGHLKLKDSSLYFPCQAESHNSGESA